MWLLQHCIALRYAMHMSEIKNNNSAWTDTHGVAKHFDMKPNTLRKQRVKQSPTTNQQSSRVNFAFRDRGLEAKEIRNYIVFS